VTRAQIVLGFIYRGPLNFGMVAPTHDGFHPVMAAWHWRPAHRGAAKHQWRNTVDWIFILVVAVILYVIVSLRVLKQYERGVVFLLGKFAGVRGPGLTLIFVPIQQMVRTSLRTITMQIPSQKIITKDNVSIDIAAVAYYHITDPENAVIAIENVYNAINQISQTTVRNVVGRFSLDQLLSDTAGINEQIKNVIDQHTEPWGTKVTAVEIKDIQLPDNMQRAMAKEAEAERERRAKIVAAEGEYQAAVKKRTPPSSSPPSS
jgi:regulator of protease activity HflC (stomatin/prohibitin superfamily)